VCNGVCSGVCLVVRVEVCVVVCVTVCVLQYVCSGAGEMISAVCAGRWIHESALMVRRPVECAILHRFLV